jgi:radical SAM superfamily enzyme YgiQ (UPF0313 family)
MNGKRTRYRSAKSVVDEIKWILSLGFKEIKFNDETFTLNRKRIFEILNTIKKENLKFSWKCNSRADLLDLPMLKLMKETGCHLIFIGIESGSQKIVDYYKKSLDLEKTKQVFKMCNGLGIDTMAHFILGAPDDNKHTINQSIKYAKETNPSYVSFNILTPYPGTEVYKDLTDKKLIKNLKWNIADPVKTSMIKTKYLSSYELEEQVKKAYKQFYFSPRYIFKKVTSLKSIDDVKSLFSGFFGLLKTIN